MERAWGNLSSPLSRPIKKTISELGFCSMTPVQAACIPLFMSHKDIAAEAVTGSGKTLAFLIPLLEIMMRRESFKTHEVGGIIITPTQELAIQISSVLSHFLQHLPMYTHQLMIGGNNPLTDVKAFVKNGAHIIIATPGRLVDMFERTDEGLDLARSVKSLEVLVLDEADRLLEMGFGASITTILSYLPKQRRTGLFSATQTRQVEHLIRAGLRNPVKVSVKEKGQCVEGEAQRTPVSLNNYYMVCEAEDKLNQLVHFLSSHSHLKVMVFFSTCAAVDYFSTLLRSLLKAQSVLSIHGKKEQRHRVFAEFKALPSGVLVCTDVMGRGVDIPQVHWVIQYDPPSSSSNFVHRCGRTARIGLSGNALVYLLPTEDAYIKFISINQKVPLEEYLPAENVPDILPQVQKLAMKDRAVYDKGKQAFVSFIRSYKNHDCQLIFRFKDLNIGHLAQGFGLLHLPKMPELKDCAVSDFTPIEVDYDTIRYKDKVREKQRQKKLKEFKETGVWPGQKHKVKSASCQPWSKQREKKAKKLHRKEAKKRKAEEKVTELEDEDDDLDELARDALLVKKLKKGKISSQQFKEDIGADSD